MAPKRPSTLNESPTASSPSCEQDEPSSTIPPFPSLSSDSESDSDDRWIIKPNKPSPNLKRSKKNSNHIYSPENKFVEAPEQANVNANTIAKSKCEPRKNQSKSSNTAIDAPNEVDKTCEVPSLNQSEMSGDVSKREELDKRSNDLQLAELDLEIYIKCVQLIAAQAKLICEVYNASKNH